MDKEKKIWFPAKQYGWGWGLPCCWQGWLVLLAYVSLTIAAVVLISPASHLALFLIAVYGLALAFASICWWKGEKPAWRWGNRK